MLLIATNKKVIFIVFSIFYSNLVVAEEIETRQVQLREHLSPLGEGVVGKQLPGIVINDPYRYMSGKPGKYIYQMIAEDHKNANTKFEIHSDYHGKFDQVRKWTLTIDHDFIEEWQADSQGNIHLVAQTDVESGYRVEFSPHLVLPTGAQHGQHWKSESSLSVYETSDPETIAFEGELLSKKVYEGRFEIITPAGKFDAILISDDYEINIGPVNIKDRRYTFYAPDVGKIAEIDGFHVSAFLFFHKRRNEVKVLMSHSQTTEKKLESLNVQENRE